MKSFKSHIKRRFKSRKGMTLVEMVVTITVLSIVAGMGVGIFTAVMQHYGTASHTSQAQQNALQMEKYIVENARVASDITTIPQGGPSPISPGTTVPVSTVTGTYIVEGKKTNIFEMYDYDGTNKSSSMNVSGIQRVKLTLQRHKVDKGDQDFLSLKYIIETTEGYTVEGLAMMPNMKLDNSRISASDDAVAERMLLDMNQVNTYDLAIVFVKS